LVIEAIRGKVSQGKFAFTQHAVDQSILRRISLEEFRQNVASDEVIENYPNDRYGPSCLVLGYTESGRPLHIHCSHGTRDLIRVITVYEPDPTRWLNFRTRRPTNDL